MSKLSKSEVEFEHPSGEKQRCSGCSHFEVLAPLHCEIVAGTIAPTDWCEKWKAKTQERNS